MEDRTVTDFTPADFDELLHLQHIWIVGLIVAMRKRRQLRRPEGKFMADDLVALALESRADLLRN